MVSLYSNRNSKTPSLGYNEVIFFQIRENGCQRIALPIIDSSKQKELKNYYVVVDIEVSI